MVGRKKFASYEDIPHKRYQHHEVEHYGSAAKAVGFLATVGAVAIGVGAVWRNIKKSKSSPAIIGEQTRMEGFKGPVQEVSSSEEEGETIPRETKGHKMSKKKGKASKKESVSDLQHGVRPGVRESGEDVGEQLKTSKKKLSSQSKHAKNKTHHAPIQPEEHIPDKSYGKKAKLGKRGEQKWRDPEYRAQYEREPLDQSAASQESDTQSHKSKRCTII